ncbi:unnamed protein product [Rhizophagus irregularis]|nr:unnamed protein product [Rhizophagus irregularis]
MPHPIARAAVVAEIVRQLGNWNIETHQNGRITSSQGRFDFNVGGARTLRAADVYIHTKTNDPFLVSIGQDNNGQLQGNIHSWKWNENNTVRHYEHGWRSMNTWVSGQEILPGFELDVEMIEESISQQDSGSSSSDDDTRFPCPKCTETFTNNHRFKAFSNGTCT